MEAGSLVYLPKHGWRKPSELRRTKKDTQLQVIQVPAELAVGADYGLIVLDGAPVAAWRFAMFILSPEGQKILSGYGFVVGGLPADD